MPRAQGGPGIEHGRRQRLQPVQYGSHRATKMQGNPLSFNQTLGALNIMGSNRMVKRFYLQAMVFIPDAGTDVQVVHLAFRISWRGGDALVESLPQQLRKELVIAVPPPLVVQRDDEQFGVFDIFHGGFPAPSRAYQNTIPPAPAQPP